VRARDWLICGLLGDSRMLAHSDTGCMAIHAIVLLARGQEFCHEEGLISRFGLFIGG